MVSIVVDLRVMTWIRGYCPLAITVLGHNLLGFVAALPGRVTRVPGGGSKKLPSGIWKENSHGIPG